MNGGVSAANVRAHWGESAPDWLLILAENCDSSSQKKVGEEIGYSSTVVNQVLKGRYTGDLTAVEKAVRGAYLNATVLCPVLGDLPVNRCLQHQRQPYANTNRLRVRLYIACRSGCAHARD